MDRLQDRSDQDVTVVGFLGDGPAQLAHQRLLTQLSGHYELLDLRLLPLESRIVQAVLVLGDPGLAAAAILSDPSFLDKSIIFIIAQPNVSRIRTLAKLGLQEWCAFEASGDEVQARIEAAFIRVQAAFAQSARLLHFEGDPQALSAGRQTGDGAGLLTFTESELFNELLQNRERVMSREELCRKVLKSPGVSLRTIDVHIASLRKKISRQGHLISTVRGVGYRLTKR